MSLRVLTWNTAGRKKRLDEQVAYLDGLGADIVCLQEVTGSTAPRLAEGLNAAGLVHVVHTVGADHPRQGPRKYGLLVAARRPLTRLELSEVVWPERLLAVTHEKCTVLTTHIPPGSTNGWTKIDMLEAVFQNATSISGPRIVCGDFNCPREETATGQVITWGTRIRKDGSAVIRRGHERWEAGERGAIEGLPAAGLLDVPRHLHGPAAPMYSYYDIRKGRVTSSRRYDHLFASPSLNPVKATYDDAPRADGLSDHSCLVVDFSAQ